MKIGIIVRTFAKTPELVERQVKAVWNTAVCFGSYGTAPNSSFFSEGSDPTIGMVDVVIPINKMFVDVDCGLTEQALKVAFEEGKNDYVGREIKGDLASGWSGPYTEWYRISSTQCGLFCGLLNEAMVRQAREGCTHSLIVSSGCADYATSQNMALLIEAAKQGALATGLAIDALSESIMAGRLANTFAMWDIGALLSVGGFDLRAENARTDNRLQSYMRGRTPECVDAFYPVSGVEEIIPLIRLVEMHGKCIKPVVPSSGLWKAPDPITDPVGYKRHVAKMATKFERQSVFAHQMGVDFTFIESGVM